MGKKTKQISLFEENTGVIEIKKHSALIAMNNTMTTFQQSKAMNAILYIAKDQLKRNSNQRRFSIPLWIIKRLGGIGRNDNRELKKGLRGLVSIVIEYNILSKDKQARWAFPFLSLIHIEGDRRGSTAIVTFELASPILEAVKHPNMYANLDLLILQELCESKYAYILFQLLKDYINMGNKRVGIENFRKLMGVPSGKYSIFTMLKKRVIDKAVEKINEKTPMTVSYDLIKTGRKVTDINFLVEWDFKHITREEINSEIVQKLKRFWIKDKQISQLFKQHDEDYLLANIAVLEGALKKWKEIRNVSAYLMKAFEIDFTPTEIKPLNDFSKNKIEENKEKWELAILEATYKQERKAKYEKLLKELSNKEITSLKEEFEEEILQTNFHSDIYKTKGFEFTGIQMEWKKFLIKKFLASEYHNFENYKRKNYQPSPKSIV